MSPTIVADDNTTETLASLRTELKARGFDYLADSRCNRFINDAYKKVVKRALWPFRENTEDGDAPLTIPDLGVIMSVRDTSNGSTSLDYIDRRALEDRFGDLTTTGTAEWFYITDGSVVTTYPVGGILSVRYWRNPARLVNDADTLIVPDDYTEIILDEAVRRAYLDSDNFNAANALRAEIEEKLGDMMVELLGQQAHGPEFIVVESGEEFM